ncbi:hypothetical protein, partial [Streptomyces sioyaensis]|uniref:hypothetical protein n=1 Tax=Streptomyces sioyaensis TaxID=67364 RepID=UPI00378CE76C
MTTTKTLWQYRAGRLDGARPMTSAGTRTLDPSWSAHALACDVAQQTRVMHTYWGELAITVWPVHTDADRTHYRDDP